MFYMMDILYDELRKRFSILAYMMTFLINYYLSNLLCNLSYNPIVFRSPMF